MSNLSIPTPQGARHLIADLDRILDRADHAAHGPIRLDVDDDQSTQVFGLRLQTIHFTVVALLHALVRADIQQYQVASVIDPGDDPANDLGRRLGDRLLLWRERRQLVLQGLHSLAE